MKKEKIKDIIAGILSLIFIVVVFYLYFLNLFGSGGIYFSLSECKTYIPNNSNSCHINVIEPTIVLRMDDVRAYSVPAPYLIDEILNRNLAVTLGVIPSNLNDDKRMISYLNSIKNNPNVEIAQHGNEHSESDIEINEENLLKGYKTIQKLLNVNPVTYIPPYNRVTSEARNLISKYFRIISSREGVIKEGENTAEIGYTESTYWYNKNEPVLIKTIINKCNESLKNTNLCVINIHPQEYAISISNPKTFSFEKFEEFKRILDELQKLNAKFLNFNELVRCS